MTESEAKEYKPKELAIIGAGLTGVFTAIFAAQLKDEQGRPRFHITLIEKEDGVLRGTCTAAARVHLGGEYPLDWKTGIDCLNSAIMWKSVMPLGKPFLTKQLPMKFSVNHSTEAIGQQCERLIATGEPEKLKDGTWIRVVPKNTDVETPEPELTDELIEQLLAPPIAGEELEPHTTLHTVETSVDGKNWQPVTGRTSFLAKSNHTLKVDDNGQLMYLTTERYIENHYRILKNNYRVLYKRFDAQKKKEDPSWTEMDTAKALFGHPDKFYKALTPHELAADVVGGFQSQERGMNIPYYLSYLDQTVRDLKEQGRISIEVGQDIASVEKKGDKFVHTTKEGRVFESDYTAGAAWDGNPALYGLGDKKSVGVFHRGILVVNNTDARDRRKLRSSGHPIFIMLGESGQDLGGMNAAFNPNTNLCYIPDDRAAYERGHKILTADDTSLPTEFQKGFIKSGQCSERDQKWIDDYFALVRKRFPALKHAVPLGMFAQNTLNFQSDLGQREHEKVQEIEPGKFTLYATKATHAIPSAIETCLLLEKREKAKSANVKVSVDASEVMNAALTGYNNQIRVSPDTQMDIAFQWANTVERGIPVIIGPPTELEDGFAKDPNEMLDNVLNGKRRTITPRKRDRSRNDDEGQAR